MDPPRGTLPVLPQALARPRGGFARSRGPCPPQVQHALAQWKLGRETGGSHDDVVEHGTDLLAADPALPEQPDQGSHRAVAHPGVGVRQLRQQDFAPLRRPARRAPPFQGRLDLLEIAALKEAADAQVLPAFRVEAEPGQGPHGFHAHFPVGIVQEGPQRSVDFRRGSPDPAQCGGQVSADEAVLAAPLAEEALE